MFDLARDSRTRTAYRGARKRARRDRSVSLPSPLGQPVDQIMARLDSTEVSTWIGWADSFPYRGSQWWLIVLTKRRMHGAVVPSQSGDEHTFSAPVGSWVMRNVGDAVIVDLAYPRLSLVLQGARWDKNGSTFAGHVPSAQVQPNSASSPIGPVVPTIAPPASLLQESAETTVIPDPQETDFLERSRSAEDPGAHSAEPLPAGAGSMVASWQDAELLAAWHMRKLGFADAELTPPGPDGGVDVRSSSAVAQVKHYAAPVGGPAVQQLRGAAHGQDWALFYTLSGYTKAAVEYAKSVNVALFTYDRHGQVQAANEAGDYLHDNAGAPDGFDIADFELSLELKELTQQMLDTSAAFFSSVGEHILDAFSATPSAPVMDSLAVEVRRVQSLVDSMTTGLHPPSEVVEASQKILEAADRLRDELPRYES